MQCKESDNMRYWRNYPWKVHSSKTGFKLNASWHWRSQHPINIRDWREIVSTNQWPIFIDLDFIQEKMADNNKTRAAPGGNSEEIGAIEPGEEDDQGSEHAECVEEMVFPQLMAPPENQ